MKGLVFQSGQSITGINLPTKMQKKVDANRYTTAMTGIKYKLAHKRAERENWNITENAQEKRLIQILERLTVQLKGERCEN
jgi:hypothetical protein